MMAFLSFAAGLVLLVAGAELMVRGASRLALALGISPLVVGLTVVALGTSAPEFAVAIKGAIEGKPDLVMGNVVGSNIFNLLGVLGLSGLLAKGELLAGEAARSVDLPFMLVTAAVCLPVFFSTGNVMHRWEGALFLGAYAVYVVYLVWNSGDGDVPGWFVDGARFGAGPLAIALVVWVAWRDRHHPSHDPAHPKRLNGAADAPAAARAEAAEG